MPPESNERHRELSDDARRRIGEALRNRAALHREGLRREAAIQFGESSDRDLFIAGVALYWAEGSKDKPWRRNGRVVLINGDPTVLELFLVWLDLVGVAESSRTYRLNIHESADVAANEAWWAARLSIPLASFARATLKRHNPKTVRHNNGETYHGCLVVSVARSGWLYYAIEGWWRALISGVETRAMVHTEGAIGPP